MKKIMIVAGEASGDVNGAALARSLKELDTSLIIRGIGGGMMRDAGVDILFDISELAAVGFSEVVKNFSRIRTVFHGFCEKLDKEKPCVLVLIDYPGFNIRLAAQAKKRGIKVVYYISPQVWAWGKNRVYEIAKYVDRMLVIFPFEKDFYEKFGIPADYVGNPLLDRIEATGAEDEPGEAVFPGGNPVICLLPGSRHQEVARHLAPMLDAASIIRRSFPGARFVIGRAGTISEQTLRKIADKYPVKAEILENARFEALRTSDFVITSSGTATVETAYFKRPMVVIYRVSYLTWFFARLLVRLEDIAMVNVIAGRRIVPELVQSASTPGPIAAAVVSILNDKNAYEKMVSDLGIVKEQLGPPGASSRAAGMVLETAEGL